MDTITTEQYGQYTIHTHYADYAEDPTEWGNFALHIFNSGFRGDLNRGDDRERFYTDNDKLRPEVAAKIRAGKLWPVGVRHYSGSDGGFYTLWDTDEALEADGFIELYDGYVKGVSLEDRRKYAESDLQIYQQWANGEVFGYTVEDKHGELIDSGTGYYSEADAIADAKADADAYKPPRATAKFASAYHG